MSIGKALRYPYQNPARLLFLVLAQSLLIFTLPVLSGGYLVRYFETNSFSTFVNLAACAIFVLDVIWLHGYSVAVIRSVLNGEEAPPRVQLTRNLREGCGMLLATLVYAVPICIVFGVAIHLQNVAFHSYLANGGAYDYSLALGVFVAVLVIHAAWIWLARSVYDIGVARFAANDYRDSLFEMSHNFSFMRRNLKTTVAHSLLQALLLAMFGLLAIYVISVGTELIPAPELHVLENMAAFNWTAVAALVLTFVYLLYWHASTHLLAQYTLAIGIGRHGAK